MMTHTKGTAMTYSVTDRHEDGGCDLVWSGDDQIEAMTQAQLAARLSLGLVFVEFFRASDHCHGYLNPGGHHSTTGEAW
jgi:hypothetical protein